MWSTYETDTNSPSSGIRSLMVAVLDDAIHCLSSPERLVRAEAEIWITNPRSEYLFSFAVICEELDIEPGAIRRSVRRLLANKQTRGRLLNRSRPNVRHKGPLRLAKSSHHLS
jgi:hypothetical protein